MSKTLSICIPTYNRAAFLDGCLMRLFIQLKSYADRVIIYISNNASTDNSHEIIRNYLENYNEEYEIYYTNQQKNLGMDGNFTFLYHQAVTKYLWMLSDDDYLVDKTIDKILSIIDNYKDFGVLYLNNFWYEGELENVVLPTLSDANVSVYSNPIPFVERVNYWFTFLSAHVVNKDIVKHKIKVDEYQGTYLALMSWILPAAFFGSQNLVMENYCLVCKGSNTGGYKLYKVFAKNLNIVIEKMIKNKLVHPKVKSIINRHLLISFFPMFYNNTNDKFLRENPLKILLPVYWKNSLFWKRSFVPLLKSFIKTTGI